MKSKKMKKSLRWEKKQCNVLELGNVMYRGRASNGPCQMLLPGKSMSMENSPLDTATWRPPMTLRGGGLTRDSSKDNRRKIETAHMIAF